MLTLLLLRHYRARLYDILLILLPCAADATIMLLRRYFFALRHFFSRCRYAMLQLCRLIAGARDGAVYATLRAATCHADAIIDACCRRFSPPLLIFSPPCRAAAFRRYATMLPPPLRLMRRRLLMMLIAAA